MTGVKLSRYWPSQPLVAHQIENCRTIESTMKLLTILRILKGISQWDLALEAGLRNYHLSHIEHGRYEPRPGELKAIAKVLKVPVSALTNEAETLAAIEAAIAGSVEGAAA